MTLRTAKTLAYLTALSLVFILLRWTELPPFVMDGPNGQRFEVTRTFMIPICYIAGAYFSSVTAVQRNGFVKNCVILFPFFFVVGLAVYFASAPVLSPGGQFPDDLIYVVVALGLQSMFLGAAALGVLVPPVDYVIGKLLLRIFEIPSC